MDETHYMDQTLKLFASTQTTRIKMSTPVFTTMPTFSEPAVFDEAVFALSELSKNTEEVDVSTDFHDEEDENQEILDILNGLKSASPTLSGNKRNIDEFGEFPLRKVRKAPISVKFCNVCNGTFHVAAPQKKCMDTTCTGKLEIKAKEPKVLKRDPPKCSKFCNVCDKMVENIPTAIKKCTVCKSLLEKVGDKKSLPQIVVAVPAPKVANIGEFDFALNRY